MLHALTFSIIEHLRNQIPESTAVVWMYDGVTLTDKVKPFLTVEQMTSDNDLIVAGRMDYEEIYRYQVGLRAKSASERSRLSETVRNVLRQTNIPFYDTRGASPVLAGFFVCDVGNAVPIPVDSTEDETNKHRVYFDVEVSVYRRNSDGLEFTQ
jgi:hypothetical protein